jgi:hypothetical protein
MLNANNREVQILASAFHEAGHAVCALNFGISVKHLYVSLDKPGDGYIAQNHFNHFNPIFPGQSSESVESAWSIALDNTRKEMAVYLSGPLAESEFLGGNPLRLRGAEVDRQHLRNLVNRVDTLFQFYSQYGQVTHLSGNSMLNCVRAETIKWMKKPKVRIAITNLATMAAHRGKLNSEQIRYLIGHTDSLNNQITLDLQ